MRALEAYERIVDGNSATLGREEKIVTGKDMDTVYYPEESIVMHVRNVREYTRAAIQPVFQRLGFLPPGPPTVPPPREAPAKASHTPDSLEHARQMLSSPLKRDRGNPGFELDEFLNPSPAHSSSTRPAKLTRSEPQFIVNHPVVTTGGQSRMEENMLQPPRINPASPPNYIPVPPFQYSSISPQISRDFRRI